MQDMGYPFPLYELKVGLTYKLGALVLWISSHRGFESLDMDGITLIDG